MQLPIYVRQRKNDPRKTRFGEFLRRTSIDELPQFVNVWRGEMSIVGPRPHMLMHTEQYTELIDRYMLRHAVETARLVTGPGAQVQAASRGPTTNSGRWSDVSNMMCGISRTGVCFLI